MLNIDRVWSRVSRMREFAGKKLEDFQPQTLINSYTLTTGQASNDNAVNFYAGAIIVGIIAAANPTGQAATQTNRPPLDMFSVSITNQLDSRPFAGPTQGIGSCVFGPFGDQFPPKEFVLLQNGSLVYNFTNLTTSTVQITIAHHCLFLKAVN